MCANTNVPRACVDVCLKNELPLQELSHEPRCCDRVNSAAEANAEAKILLLGSPKQKKKN